MYSGGKVKLRKKTEDNGQQEVIVKNIQSLHNL